MPVKTAPLGGESSARSGPPSGSIERALQPSHVSSQSPKPKASPQSPEPKRGRPVARIVPVDDPTEHTGVELAQWLHANPVPRSSARMPEELDAHIAAEPEVRD